MAIERWDPFREAVSLRDAVNSLFQESFVRSNNLIPAAAGGATPLPLDVRETPEAFVVEASLPGIRPEDVEVTVHGDTLTIRGETRAEEETQGETWHLRERRSGAFRRTVTLPVPVDADKATADHDHGVLKLTLPKAESARPKQIKVGPTAASS